ncbi:MAG: glycogen/starch/alpha-glucan phosphorylase [Chloroflexota bacterium]|nr:glycogen/starch/alpha-glucan phosphorylase [Chloroflexota bacterium]
MDTNPSPDTRAAPALAASSPAADAAKLRRRVAAKLVYQVGRDPETAGERDWFVAAALAARDRVVDRWMASDRRFRESRAKQVCYLSLEFLPGPLLPDVLGNLGLTEAMRSALAGAGVDLDRVRSQEPDPALGNGGLGRLAACYMESMASVGVPAFGYGIRYDHGLFRQVIRDGVQHELPEDWLALGNPWEFERPEVAYAVGFGGSVAAEHGGPDGALRYVWHPAETVTAAAYDTPVVGWGGEQVNTLRLWSARAGEALRLDDFNRGDHVGALSGRMRAEAISRVLYPGDDTPAGQELRLRQEYFFAAASLQDVLRRHLRRFGDLRSLPEGAAVQINDTHPAIGIAELVRLLVDVHGLGWDEAWGITRRVFSYTNHTLLPEALESWPVALLEWLLPRHMQIVYLINAGHLEAARAAGRADDDGVLAAVSLIDEHHGRRVRMGHLAFVGSRRVNGVSALHTGLMRRTVFRELDGVLPGRIVNKTNGVTFRRWLHRANPRLTALLVEALGERVLREPEALEELAPHADDAGFRDRFRMQRREAKLALADRVASRLGVAVDPDALFDVQVKRVHEYKRQLLNVLHAVALYDAIRARPTHGWAPVVKVFAGKAAAGYHRAKLVIRLAHDVARAVNADPTARGLLKVAFLPNYNVSLAEAIIPAADLSEQISTAGMEASGTGNMKLALNGALTIGTLDGATVEIRERVGSENAFIFGLTAEEVRARRLGGGPDARALVEASPALSQALDAIAGGVFSPDEPERYRGLVGSLLENDPFMVLADFDAYCEAHRSVAALWADPDAWWRASVLNTARVGWFSSDRAVREYAEGIWGVPTRPLA